MGTAILGATGVIALLGAVHFFLIYSPRERERLQSVWREQLLGRVEVRLSAVEQWLEDRILDARIMAAYPSVRARVQSGPVDLTLTGQAPGHLRGILRDYATTKALSAVVVVDHDLEIVDASLSEPRLDPSHTGLLRTVLSSGEPVVEMITLADGRAVVSIVVPVLGAHPAEPPIGALAMDIDPAGWLFPFLSSTRLEYRTGEVLLVRRDGDTLTYLTPPRFTETAPMVQRVAFDSTLGVARALEGLRRFGAGHAYRGARVLSAGSRLRQVPWALVVEVDQAEVYQGYRRTLVRAGVGYAAVLVAIASLVGAIWWRQREAVEGGLIRSQDRLAHVFHQANDAIFFVGLDGTILEANRRAEEFYRTSDGGLAGRSMLDLRPDALADRATSERNLERIRSRGQLIFEAMHRRDDSTVFPVEISSRLATIGTDQVIVSVVRDLTDRQEAERHIAQLHRLRRIQADVNALVAHETDTEAVLAGVCRIAAEHGELPLAWVGRAELDGRVTPIHQAGPAREYLVDLTVRWDDTPLGTGPTGRALREGRLVVNPDFRSEAPMSPWSERALRHGLRSSGAVPITCRDGFRGVLSLYATLPRAFEGEVAELVEALGADLSFALDLAVTRRERDESARALRETSRALQAAFRASPTPIVSLDRDGRVTIWNPAAERVFGWTAAETLGRRPPFVGTEHEGEFGRLRERVHQGETFTATIRRRRSDGRSLDLSLHAAPLRDDADNVTGILALLEDVTERLLAEEALRASEARFRRLFESAGVGIALLDPDMVSIAANPALCTSLGQASTDLARTSLLELTHPEDRLMARALYDELLGGHRESYRVQMRFVRKDSSLLWAAVTASAVRGSGDRAQYAIAMVEDVTERVQAEEALVISEERLRALVQSDLVGINFADTTGRIYDANGEFLRITGRTRTELLRGDLSWDRLTPPEYQELDRERAAEAIKRGVCPPYEKEFIRPDGSRVWVLVGYVLLEPARDKGVAFVLDITQRKRAEEEVHRLNQDLEERVRSRTRALESANHELETFSYSVSHDLRAPLRAIAGFSRALTEDHAETLNPEARRLVQVVQNSTRRMSQLIDDLLAFSRTGRHELRHATVDMHGLAREAFESQVSAERRGGITFALDPLPPAVGDPALLRQVWANLLANAIKFTGATPGARIDVTARAEPGRVVYQVRDNGVGFDMQYAHRLFGVFHRLHSSEFEGTGVGLALVKQIIDRHGGEVRAEGAVGAGATLSFSLPVEPRPQ